MGGIYVDPDTGAQGYILDNTPKTNTPCPGMDSIDLLVAFAPDLTGYRAKPGLSIKTASNSGAVEDSTIITGATTVNAKVDISFYSPHCVYTYFATGYPLVPRFTTMLDSRQPVIIRALYSATASGGGNSVQFGGQAAPLSLVAALSMPIKDELSDFAAEPILGTPWYRVTCTISRIYLSGS